MKNKYMPTALALYINYFVHGMGAIILSQNMDALMQQFNTDRAGVSYVISGLGIGRLLVLFVSGALSDKFGRKPFVLLGIVTYMIFLGGILVAPNVSVALILAILAGMANSFMDSGTYPALMEAFPESSGSANIIIKAFIAAGQFVLPFIISFLIANDLWYGYSFLFCMAIFVINGLFLLKLQFPAHKVEKAEVKEESVSESNEPKSNFWIEGIALILIGFTATATFYIIQNYLPTYGQEVAGMEKSAALKLISLYSAGSFTAVVVTSILVAKWIKQVRFVFVYPLISLVMLVLLYLFPSPMMCVVGSFVIGYSAAGGVLQLALTTMSELFPKNKGTITGIVYTASSLASSILPALIGVIASSNVSNIMLLNIVITAIGVILALIVNIRYNMTMSSRS
ncbi:MFS transporter [Turicibacter sp. TJ11]|uniref:MFS transporter n=1 Tax=Turicibacter sp. TJ11 TaxID=2806443 RepID=UPI001F3C0D85|nr:MFS transporter [Turicibacter sp. TJ11]